MIEHQPWMDDRLLSAQNGTNPTVIMKMKSGYLVLGDYQHLPGYCVLIGEPFSPSLNALPLAKRTQFTLDMTLAGDALVKALQANKVNYAVMGNLDMLLHAHIWARYTWEPKEYRFGPAWSYTQEERGNESCYFTNHLELIPKIQKALQSILEDAAYWQDA